MDADDVVATEVAEKVEQVDEDRPGVLIDGLAVLPERTILDEARLAGLLAVTRRTVRRMVNRFELPPPTRLAGRSMWLAGRVLSHIEAAAERAERKAERVARKIRQVCS